ncbi:UDP-glycosyltransferase 83A1 [Acorus gramineus]|uniref:UDP-glycosyltransferase 83A1 n=1 Tax=Acorus gramineus TaxID=55184 RepID=A0AAV9AIK2_ACOGR|nr:UDP-glycosyltransferase 83A1 [Acorus gramineus]
MGSASPPPPPPSPPPPHALVLPCPAQGHVIPLMELSHRLVDRGFTITFVNTHFDRARVRASQPGPWTDTGPLRLVSIPDGLDPRADRNDLGRLTLAMQEHMPGHLEELIRDSSAEPEPERGPLTCVIADHSMAWALDVAKKMGLRAVAFWPSSAGLLATMLDVPNMIEDGIIDTNGIPMEQKMIELGPGMPSMNTTNFWWNSIGDPFMERVFFDAVLRGTKSIDSAECILCNSFTHAELPVFKCAPKIRPIGPLLPGLQPDKVVGHYWPEDSSCVGWLNQQPPKSVVYVAFGSFTVFTPQQFQELALGLEMMGRRFLWVVRPDITEKGNTTFSGGFKERVAGRGKMVGWSPQQRVLAHPSVACFVSHCGWNSTMEGITNGVPFLCWPYFADQFLNEAYICDTWKVGLRLSKNAEGIVTRGEIKAMVEALLGDGDVVGRALELKEVAARSIGEGGSSFDNFNEFVESMKKHV